MGLVMPHPGTPKELVMPHLGTPEEPVMPHLGPGGYRVRATVRLTSLAGVGPEMVKMKFFKSSRMDLPVAVRGG